SVNKYSLSRRNLMIYTTIAFEINQTLAGNVVDKPADLIHVGFNDHFERMTGIDHAHGSSIWIRENIIYKWSYIVDPQLLSGIFKSDGRGSVDIISKK